MNDRKCGQLVMIVEDDLDVRDAIVQVLEDYHFRALGAGNGREALDELRSSNERPCMILLDVMMPVMDGWQFRSEQKRDPALGTIPVVVLTAHGMADDVAATLEADAFLRKPVQLDALISMVERFCPVGHAPRQK